MKKIDDSNNVFIEVTNKDIFNEIKEMRKDIELIHKKQDCTNGKVKKSMWVATTAITLSLMILTFLIQHISK